MSALSRLFRLLTQLEPEISAVPDARSMPGTEGMANEENKRGRYVDEDGIEGGAGLLGLEGI